MVLQELGQIHFNLFKILERVFAEMGRKHIVLWLSLRASSFEFSVGIERPQLFKFSIAC